MQCKSNDQIGEEIAIQWQINEADVSNRSDIEYDMQ